MEQISVFDMLKIGIGPSSSHTLGPWRAAQKWLLELEESGQFDSITAIQVHLYGSLSLTGKGHATDLAIILGLVGEDPETIPVEDIPDNIEHIKSTGNLMLRGSKSIPFSKERDIIFERDFLDYHPNGLEFIARLNDGETTSSTYFSIGGGFVVHEFERQEPTEREVSFPFPIQIADDLAQHCLSQNKSISEIVLANELTLRSKQEIEQDIDRVWTTMLECMYIGCHSNGTLPGGLNVVRRAARMSERLNEGRDYDDMDSWFKCIRIADTPFAKVMKWVSCFALSVNEVNASMGRIVTAPTNGSAGVIPAVLMYYLCFVNENAGQEEIRRFLLTAGEIGSIIKKGATISAAMGGCQAEIGVSSAMAAGALTEVLGGSPDHVLVAAEIALEHHLGLTCDPIGGLVQIPCIERNSMGAVKAITAAELALDRDPTEAQISLDMAVKTMMETAKDMSRKYKETSEGGLAIAVNMPAC